MTLSSIVALVSAMVVLASIPSMSVLAVCTRAATGGFIHGVFTTIGIVVGDIIFIILAIGGLSLIAQTMGSVFVLIKYLGGAYLIWLGIGLCRSKLQDVETPKITETSLLSSFMAGLLLTLGDLKATFFYLGFFPAFIDLSKISYWEASTIIAIAIVAVGGVKLGYAFIASRARLLISAIAKKRINTAAGCVLIAVGIFLITTK